MRARSVGILFFSLALAACSNDGGNPFAASGSRPASADAVVMFVTSSWADAPGQPRELFAANADGTKIERLTSCSQAATPCDFLRFAISPDPTRIAAIRTTPGAAPGASALYFMDLSRSVEQLIFPRRRVAAVDWSSDGASLLYQSSGDQPSDDDNLYICDPNGGNDQQLTATSTGAAPVRERSPRFDPSASAAVYERIDETGVGRIYLYPAVPLTTGPASGPALPETPYFVGDDADPAFSPDVKRVVFRRLTGIGNGGLGTWDLLTIKVDGSDLRPLVSGAAFRGAPDWSSRGVVFVETDAAANESRLVVIQADGTGRTVLHKEAADYAMAAPRWIRGR
jgi:Tol biopolymer transport system component